MQGAAQHVALQRLDLGVDGFADRLVVLRDEVQQGVQHEVFAMVQQQRARLAALAHQGIGGRVAVAGGDDVAVAGKDMGFDELQLAVLAYRRIGDDEQRVAEGFKLGPAVLLQGVFDGQFMQAELALQVGQLFGVGLFQADPHEMISLAGPLRPFVEADVGDFLSGAVDGCSNDSTHGYSLLDLRAVKAGTK